MAIGSNTRAAHKPYRKRPRADARQKAIDEPWVLWARVQRNIGLFALGSVAIIGLLSAIIMFQWNAIASQNRTIAHLSSERIMIGMPQPDGTFISVDGRPREMIRDYADTFVRNLYNYDSDSVTTNFMQVMAMYDARQRNDIRERLADIRNEVVGDGLSQLFAPTDHQLRATDNGFEYRTRGTVYQYGGQLLVHERHLQVTVELASVPPTEADPLGVVVVRVSDRTLEG